MITVISQSQQDVYCTSTLDFHSSVKSETSHTAICWFYHLHCSAPCKFTYTTIT